MKTVVIRIFALILFFGQMFYVGSLFASNDQLLSSQLDMYVFPQNGQDKETQEMDEYESYKWAVDQTGVNPINPPEIEAEQVDTSPDGSAVKGSAKGAAAGAAVGAIAGDAGKGAAIGATAGAIGGARSKRHSDAVAQEQANAEAAQATEDAMTSFKKAFAAAMEGKGYTVKF